MIPPWDARGCFGLHADPDAPVDVAPEMMITQRIPTDPPTYQYRTRSKELIAAKNDKGMKIFTPRSTRCLALDGDGRAEGVGAVAEDGSLAAGMAARRERRTGNIARRPRPCPPWRGRCSARVRRRWCGRCGRKTPTKYPSVRSRRTSRRR